MAKNEPVVEDLEDEEEIDESELEVDSDGVPQIVDEVRPQGFTQGLDAQRSATDRRTDRGKAATQAEYDAAKPTKENEARAARAGRVANFITGQRVQIVGGDEAGRMAYIMSTEYESPIDMMLAQSGTPEARFAKVAAYIIRTRDGRSDTFSMPPEDLMPLDENNGWGRGSI